MGWLKKQVKKVTKSVKKTVKNPLRSAKRVVKATTKGVRDTGRAFKKIGKEHVEFAKRAVPVGDEGYFTKGKKDVGRLLNKLGGIDAAQMQNKAMQDADADARRAAADARRSEVFAQTSGAGGGVFGNIALGADEDEDDETKALRLGKTTLQL